MDPYYKDEVAMESDLRRSSRYHDFYDRPGPGPGPDRYEYDRDVDYFPQGPEDPFRMSRSLLPRPRDPMHDLPYKEPVPDGAVTLGRVVLYPANPLEPKPSRRPKPLVCRTIFVGSLPDSCTERHLDDLFAACGTIVEVRVSRGRNFGHVQFSQESSVERAMNISGCKIRIENSPMPKDCTRVHVDYAQDKTEMDLKRRIEGNDLLIYTASCASNIAGDLHKDGVFCYAARNVANWLNKGECRPDTANNFFDLITNVNSYGRKVAKYIQNKEEEELEFTVKKHEYFKSLQNESNAILEVYEGAACPKARNSFTKAQRKSISQWKDQAVDIQERIKQKLEDDVDGNEPPSKIMKTDGEAGAKLERALREIEQLKVDQQVAVEKRDKQILQLKTLMAKFKKSFPEQWGEALGITESPEAEDAMKIDAKETIDGVGIDDLNDAMDREASKSSLASAAAAYASIKKSVGSSETGLSEAEVAIVAVLATFLAVHPLGASIEAITAYFKTFNPAYNTYYLEALLRRLTQVFQFSASGGAGDEGAKKWWFLGFQTCYATPSSKEGKESEKKLEAAAATTSSA